MFWCIHELDSQHPEIWLNILLCHNWLSPEFKLKILLFIFGLPGFIHSNPSNSVSQVIGFHLESYDRWLYSDKILNISDKESSILLASKQAIINSLDEFLYKAWL